MISSDIDYNECNVQTPEAENCYLETEREQMISKECMKTSQTYDECIKGKKKIDLQTCPQMDTSCEVINVNFKNQIFGL